MTLVRDRFHRFDSTAVARFVAFFAGGFLLFSAGYLLSASASKSPTSPTNPLVSSVQGLYKSMGLVSDDELGLDDESDQVTIDEGENGLSETIEKKTVQRGDSIYNILSAAGLTPAEIHELTSQLKGDKTIRGFRAGKSYELETGKDGSFTRFTWKADPTTIIHLTKNQETGKLGVNKEIIELETRIATIEGTLHTSLAKELSSKNRSGLSAQLNRILSSKINFRRDIRDGTTYKILYQEQWLDGQFSGTGDILAVEINTRGRKINAYQFEDAKGNSAYYDEKGRALAQASKSLYITPCRYNRISSGFGYRTHPITHRRQFHGGVDLAAPTGTPVKAVADGRVIFRGRKGNAGNLVTIAHGGGTHTMYMHLSRFASSCRYGKYVKQGDIIGYVGSTGRSTGPHLDFRIIKNGRLKNPMVALRQKAPTRSLSKKELQGFMAKVQMYQNQLEGKGVMVAGVSKQGENDVL
ncbi:Peptidase M23 [Chlorobaculum parvum NCIB 8327]|uniref:Peptidase M23 n=2 Tax=Chlorobaculum parvum TaxID=274539 RepID=B3QR14_CHLP8|nr:Peptidase M23 [Chlorobaculum parvum NCIB 8327]